MSEVFIEHNLEDWLAVLSAYPVEIRQEVMPQVAQRVGREMLRRFRRTVQGWRRRPRFDIEVDSTPNSVTVLGGTDDKIYGYVDRGTRAHTIQPRGAGYPLRFQSAYTAKTTPGVLGSGQGGPSGPFVAAYRVRHPGTKARRFSELILKEVRPMGYKLLVKLARRAAQKRIKWAASRSPR
jgi:hypothetical protein